MSTPNRDLDLLTVEVPMVQFKTDTTISAWCAWPPAPTARTVLILRHGVLLWASRAELAPILFPDTPVPITRLDRLCAECSEWLDRWGDCPRAALHEHDDEEIGL